MIYIYIHMQITFTTVNWLLHLAAALCVVLYSSVAVNTTVAVLTLLAGVAALKKSTVVGDGCRACNIDGICRTDL